MLKVMDMNGSKKTHRYSGILTKFRSNRDGIAAVEFAMIVPILLGLYLGTVEISNGITVNKRIARVASTVGDLVTQQEDVSKTDLHAIFDIGAAVMFPYTTTQPKITVIGVNVHSSYPQGGKVAWSRDYENGSYSKPQSSNADIAVPSQLQIDDTFIIKVTSEIEYRPVVSWVISEKTGGGGKKYAALDMSEDYWLRPRLSSKIDCSDC